jgi:hypothetical protein
MKKFLSLNTEGGTFIYVDPERVLAVMEETDQTCRVFIGPSDDDYFIVEGQAFRIAEKCIL